MVWGGGKGEAGRRSQAQITQISLIVVALPVSAESSSSTGRKEGEDQGAREAATPRGDAWSVAFSFFLSCRHRLLFCLSCPSQAEPYHSRHHFSFGSRGSRIESAH